jgi:hypothetical protein
MTKKSKGEQDGDLPYNLWYSHLRRTHATPFLAVGLFMPGTSEPMRLRAADPFLLRLCSLLLEPTLLLP